MCRRHPTPDAARSSMRWSPSSTLPGEAEVDVGDGVVRYAILTLANLADDDRERIRQPVQLPVDPRPSGIVAGERRRAYDLRVTLTIELDREEDGRYIAEVPELPGVMVYAHTESEAITRAKALALRVLAEMVEEHDERQIEHLLQTGLSFSERHAA